MTRVPVGDLTVAEAARTPAQRARLLEAEMDRVRAEFADAELLADPDEEEEVQHAVDLAARFARLANAWAACIAGQWGLTL